MTERKQKMMQRTFTFVMSLVLAFIVAVFSVAAYKHCNRTDTPRSEYNVDSIRRAHRALVDSIREARCVTLEDSIHHFEDGY